VIAAAPTRGWSVEQGRAAAERRLPARLEMARLRPDVCDLVVRGNRTDFVAESWSATRFNLGAVIGFRTRLCLVRVPAPAAVSPVVIGALPQPNLDVMTPASVTTETPMLFPRMFSGQTQILPEGPLVVAGTHAPAAVARLRPLVPEIVAHRDWLVLDDGAVVVMSHVEPDAYALERRVALAQRAAGAIDA
jgi:hypothetical protein